MMEVFGTWGFWLIPVALFVVSVFALVRSTRTNDEGAVRRLIALAGALNMAALLSIQLHANVRGEAQIREEAAKLSAPRPFPTDARAHAIEQSIARSRLNEIVREADDMGPWLLTFVSIVLGMNLATFLPHRHVPGSAEPSDMLGSGRP